MNICFFLASFTQGGIARTVSLVGNELAKNPDYHITALCHSNVGKKDIYQTSFEITYLYDRVTPVTNAMLKDHYIRKVSNYLNEKKIDLLILCGELFAPAAVIAGRKIRVLFWFHTSPYVGSDYRFQKLGRRIGFSRCDGIIVISDKAKEIIQKSYPRKKVIRIYNAVDTVLFEKQCDYQPDTEKIISVGRLSYPKNFQSLIRTAALVKEELPRLKWHIYGEGDERADLEALIKEKNLEDTVILKGHSSDLYERYNDYSAYVMTSRYEGFPMTLLEASACGLPLLSYDILTGPSEIITDGENGFLCPAGDEEEMKKRIIRLFSDRELRIKMSENGRRMAQKLRIDSIAEQWSNVIDGKGFE